MPRRDRVAPRYFGAYRGFTDLPPYMRQLADGSEVLEDEAVLFASTGEDESELVVALLPKAWDAPGVRVWYVHDPERGHHAQGELFPWEEVLTWDVSPYDGIVADHAPEAQEALAELLARIAVKVERRARQRDRASKARDALAASSA